GQPVLPAATTAKIKEDLMLREQILKSQFDDFLQSMLKLKQRLERSKDPAELEKATKLDRLLERVRDKAISTQFDALVGFLQTPKFANAQDIREATQRANKFASELITYSLPASGTTAQNPFGFGAAGFGGGFGPPSGNLGGFAGGGMAPGFGGQGFGGLQ